MGEPTLLRLYPPPAHERPCAGTYLAHRLRDQLPPDRALVYTDFIASLDGRISHVNPRTGLREVPPALSNPVDMRLFMELAAQADVLLTTTRHLRAVAAGRHSELLTLAAHPDLLEWRRAQGLPERPMVVALGREFDLPVEALRRHYPGPLTLLIAHLAAQPSATLAKSGVRLVGQPQGFGGRELIDWLISQGLRVIFSIAGPRVLRLLLDADRLDRLYLTLPAVLIGGDLFDTLGVGPPLPAPCALPLRELHLDLREPAGAGQLLAMYARG